MTDVADMKRAGVWVVSVPVEDLASALSELRSASVELGRPSAHDPIGGSGERFGHVVP